MFRYIKAGRCFGPVTAADLINLYDARVLGAEDQVRPEDGHEWEPARRTIEALRSGRLPSNAPAPERRSRGPGARVFTSAPPIPPNPLPRVDSEQCPSCAGEVSPDANHCSWCGIRLRAPICGACARANRRDARYCDGCGTRIERTV
jgi:hypothetical protein